MTVIDGPTSGLRVAPVPLSEGVLASSTPPCYGPIFVIKQWLKEFSVWAVLVSSLWLTCAVVTSSDLVRCSLSQGLGPYL